jgi:Family of unknown function (DUF5946)
VDTSACPGCGARLPIERWTPDDRLIASPACRRLYGEVTGFESIHPSLAGRFHQLSVDAYGAQHADPQRGAIRLTYSLVGLYLALVRGADGLTVREAHRRMGRPDGTWPSLSRPAAVGSVTVIEVADAGLRSDSVEGHAGAVRRWADDV